MNKYILMLMLFPVFATAQYRKNSNTNRSLISSVELGTTLYHTNVLEVAALVGLKDTDEGSTFEIGYVFKHILNDGVGHAPSYHGIRGAIEVSLIGAFGAYGTYDVIAGKRWLYDDVLGGGLKVHSKIHGEGTLGVFCAPGNSLLKFYAGLEPHHYDPLKTIRGLTPHKSSTVNLKVKYTLNL